MKCWKCGNDLTTGDAPNSAQCRRCEQASVSTSHAFAPYAVLTVEVGPDGKCTEKGKADINAFLDKHVPKKTC